MHINRRRSWQWRSLALHPKTSSISIKICIEFVKCTLLNQTVQLVKLLFFQNIVLIKNVIQAMSSKQRRNEKQTFEQTLFYFRNDWNLCVQYKNMYQMHWDAISSSDIAFQIAAFFLIIRSEEAFAALMVEKAAGTKYFKCQFSFDLLSKSTQSIYFGRFDYASCEDCSVPFNTYL